jgi:hypothetical protein
MILPDGIKSMIDYPGIIPLADKTYPAEKVIFEA